MNDTLPFTLKSFNDLVKVAREHNIKVINKHTGPLQDTVEVYCELGRMTIL